MKNTIGHPFIPGKKIFDIIHCIHKHPTLSAKAQIIYTEICIRSMGKAYCWPSQKLLAKDTGIQVRHLNTCLSELRTEGFIRMEKHNHKSRYYIIWTQYLQDNVQEDPTSEHAQMNMSEHAQMNMSSINEKFNKNNKSTVDRSKDLSTHSPPASDSIRSLKKSSHMAGAEHEKQSSSAVKISHKVQTIIDYYYFHTDRRIPDPSTKTFKDIVNTTISALNGTMINGDQSFNIYSGRKFTVEEIKACIDKHAMTYEDDYQPANKKLTRIHLHDFLYNPYKKSYRSFLIQWMESDPQMVPQYEQNVGNRGKPIIVNHIMKSRNWTELEQLEMDKLINGSLRIHRFFMNNQYKWRPGSFLPTEGGMSQVVIEAANKFAEQSKEKTVFPGFYSSNYFIKTYLPQFCEEKGYMK